MGPKQRRGLSDGGRAAYLEEERRKKFVPPVWTSSRPKPVITEAAWDPVDSENLARYMDWHARHPHSSTPRDVKDIEADHKRIKLLKRDEDDPNLVYFPSLNADVSPVPAHFTPTLLGADGNFEDCSIVATVYERQANLAGGRDSDDPWYTMSVKDRLEQFHYDGDHTTQKYSPPKGPKKTESQLRWEREQEWQKGQYGAYVGGGPAFEGAKRQIIEALSLARPNDDETKKKVGPWETEYVCTRFTKDGTNLEEFNQIEVEKRVNKALETFRAMSASKPEPAKKKKAAALKNVMAAGMGALFGGGGAPIMPEKQDDSGGGGGSSANGGSSNDAAAGDEDGDGDGDGGSVAAREDDDMSQLTMEDGASSVNGLDSLDGRASSSKKNSARRGSKGSGSGSGSGKQQLQKALDGLEKKASKKKKKKHGVDFVEELKLAMDVIEEDRAAEAAAEAEEAAAAAAAEAPPPPDPNAGLGKYELMLKKMGGEDVCEKRADEWIKFAEHVRKQSKRDRDLFDFSTDLYDACNSGNVVKVLFILGVQGIEPDSVDTPEDEPLIIHMINRIIVADDITGSLHDSAGETPDRAKLHRVLQALLKFGWDPTTLEGKGGLGAVHLAAMANNSKLLHFLLENGCNGAQWTRSGEADPTNCLNIAAKYGFVQIIAVLLRKAVRLDTKDELGRTALHWAGFFGQTRTAIFLLQCGADKRIKDNAGKSPGILAEETGYIITGQQILTYTVPAFQSMTVLQYYADRIKAEDAAAEAASKSMGNKVANTFKTDAATAAKDRLKDLGESFIGFVGSVIRGTVSLGRRVLGLPAAAAATDRPGTAPKPSFDDMK